MTTPSTVKIDIDAGAPPVDHYSSFASTRSQFSDFVNVLVILVNQGDKEATGASQSIGSAFGQSFTPVNTLLEHMLKLNFGEEKVHFVNCNERFLTEDSTGHQALNYELLLEDNLHLTPAGLEEWAKCASEDIRSGLTDP
eukprot:jgi/Undpi1/172/HiC_scaffold_1.g00169.m1